MALFHQIRRADPNAEMQQRQEKAFSDRKNTDVDGKALQRALERLNHLPELPPGSPGNQDKSQQQEAERAFTNRGRKPDPNAKKLLTLRLDPDVIEHFKATGEGWQTRMNEALRKAAGI